MTSISQGICYCILFFAVSVCVSFKLPDEPTNAKYLLVELEEDISLPKPEGKKKRLEERGYRNAPYFPYYPDLPDQGTL